MPFDLSEEDEDRIEPIDSKTSYNSNMYIEDKEKALKLLCQLIRDEKNPALEAKKRIEKRVNYLFSLFSEVMLEDKMAIYEQFRELCLKLLKRQKNQQMQNKVIVALGGCVSAGKSKFINTISGIGDKLPVDQKTTTAIPTYITKSAKDFIRVLSVDGYYTDISSEALKAIEHEFYNRYGIGFPAFVDSIIIGVKKYALSRQIVLLDTPGYTKYEGDHDARRVVTDRERASAQLSVADYLIWLVDIDSGAITEEDISFIESLNIKTPILIVFTKADKKTETEIEEIICAAEDTMEGTAISCFGITAYSATQRKEYGKQRIHKFLEQTVRGENKQADILEAFSHLNEDMENSINNELSKQKELAKKKLFSYISSSIKVLENKSLASLWGKTNMKVFELKHKLQIFKEQIGEIENEIEIISRREKTYGDKKTRLYGIAGKGDAQ